jgi:hypothetical protein
MDSISQPSLFTDLWRTRFADTAYLQIRQIYVGWPASLNPSQMMFVDSEWYELLPLFTNQISVVGTGPPLRVISMHQTTFACWISALASPYRYEDVTRLRMLGFAFSLQQCPSFITWWSLISPKLVNESWIVIVSCGWKVGLGFLELIIVWQRASHRVPSWNSRTSPSLLSILEGSIF